MQSRWRMLKAMLLLTCLSTSTAGALSAAASAQTHAPAWQQIGDAIPASLTGVAGDPQRGRAIVSNRRLGLCLLCHSGPFAEAPFQGDLAPSLAGAGARWSEGQLRLRMVDASKANPDTIMPAYFQTAGLTQVGGAWREKTILSAQQIEDVVALLVSLQ